MFHYHSLWINSLFPRITPTNERVGVGIDIIQNKSLNHNTELSSRSSHCSATISSPPLTIPKTPIYQTDISLHRSKEWIQGQREQLQLLLKEGSLQKVEALLQASLNDIKTITERHLGFCNTILAAVQNKKEPYRNFLSYLDNLQRQLKPLLQGGMLFHPDHVLNLTHNQAMKELITLYSQAYLEQSRGYLDSLKNYNLHIEDFYQQKQQLSAQWSDLAQCIQKLSQSIKELKQSFKDFAKELNQVIVQREKDKKAMEAQRERDRTEIREEFETKRTQDKADTDAQINELRNLFALRQQHSLYRM